MGFVLLACAVGGVALYFLIVRPFFVPLTKRIPTGKSYRATLTGSRQHRCVSGS